MRILIIEDDPDSLEIARRVVNQLGHDAITAMDGLEGVRLATAENPDVMVVDMNLPSLDGSAVIRAVRRTHPHMRIIGVSAGVAGEREMAAQAGCDDFFAKPYDLAALRSALR